jgi:hypothetical protein
MFGNMSEAQASGSIGGFVADVMPRLTVLTPP